MRIDAWLQEASERLRKATISSHRLDAEVLLTSVLQKDRSYLHAHGEDTLDEPGKQRADGYLRRREQRMPIAYILGRKEFYGRDFTVTPSVLIPRPETETLIELIENLPLSPQARIADIGCGSGAIAITLKLNQPTRQLIATDISPDALAIAQENATQLGADIIFLQGDLLKPLRNQVDVIVANLPYVDRDWERSPETNFEPALALFAENHGLALIERLLLAAGAHLAEAGYVVLEADPEQHDAIVSFAKKQSLRHVRTEGYVVILSR